MRSNYLDWCIVTHKDLIFAQPHDDDVAHGPFASEDDARAYVDGYLDN